MATIDSWEAVEAAIEERRVALGAFATVPQLPPMEQLSLPALQQWLQYLGGVLAYLQVEQGKSKAKAKALHDEHDLKMARQKGFLPDDLPKSTSEATKESMVYAKDNYVWDVKWAGIVADGIVLMQDGYIRSFDKAWETISRQITALTKEAEMTPGGRVN